jgi:hypothetical protein
VESNNNRREEVERAMIASRRCGKIPVTIRDRKGGENKTYT